MDSVLIIINNNDYIELQKDVKKMKTDIKEIKNTLGELVEMRKSRLFFFFSSLILYGNC